MVGFKKVALLQSHQELQPLHEYYVADLVELAGLAAFIRDSVDDVALPVSPADRAPFATFERFLRRQRPDLVGISTFTSGAASALIYAELAKRHGAFVVLGGYHPTALPDEVLASPFVDAVARGQGERTLEELVRTGSPEGVAGISWRDGARLVHNPDRTCLESLDTLPLPLRELRPERFGCKGRDYHTDTIYASRGCRGKCVFCANHLINGPWRGRSLEGLLAELESIPPPHRSSKKIVKFWDSIFLADAERVEELCRAILEAGFERHFRFIAETRVEDVIRAREILPLMHQAGFARIGIGVESPSPRTHRTLRKGINLDHVSRAAELVAAANIQLTKFLIVGHRGESEEDVLAYPDWSLGHGVRLQGTTFFVLTPYPGTELAAERERTGPAPDRDWRFYTNFGAVEGASDIPATRLQVLHAAVALRYGIVRRFLAGKDTLDIVSRAAEPLLLLTKVSLMRGRGHDEVVGDLLAALELAAGTTSRPSRERRGKRRVVRFHGPASSVAVGIVHENGEERLVVERDTGPLPGSPREIHVSLPRLVGLAAALNNRRIMSDALTLSKRPSGFKVRWLPGLAADLGTLLGHAAGMAGFHVRATLRR